MKTGENRDKWTKSSENMSKRAKSGATTTKSTLSTTKQKLISSESSTKDGKTVQKAILASPMTVTCLSASKEELPNGVITSFSRLEVNSPANMESLNTLNTKKQETSPALAPNHGGSKKRTQDDISDLQKHMSRCFSEVQSIMDSLDEFTPRMRKTQSLLPEIFLRRNT